jgi:hypothetical protein
MHRERNTSLHGGVEAGPSAWARIGWVVLFSAAFGFVEGSVVVYLRALFYPGGFQFPLKNLPDTMIHVELVREMATIVMLGAVGMLAGRERWSRFGAFLLAFGVWDLVFYLSLKIVLDWPSSFFDWDILFLLPLPWIGPVIAPVIVALIMTLGGGWLILIDGRGRVTSLTWRALVLGACGTALLLSSFMADTPATLGGAMPQPYAYWMLAAGAACYCGAFASLRRTSKDAQSKP